MVLTEQFYARSDLENMHKRCRINPGNIAHGLFDRENLSVHESSGNMAFEHECINPGNFTHGLIRRHDKMFRKYSKTSQLTRVQN